LELLPEICAQFEEYRAEAEKVVQAQITAAYPVSDAHKASIIAALKQRLGREVTLDCQVDETLLGGAIIRAGDMVIDGSITGHLDRLTHTLSQ
jgi:F-type H+-transporting ATPase subunit delta